MKKLVLIDGHAILHRAFHALPTKISFNAVYGFTTMMLRILEDLKPDFLAVAFDLPGPNFRQQIYLSYQGKRPEMQGNLVEQIPLVHEMLEKLKVPFFEVNGFEADDCIGTLVTSSQEQGVDETIIVTGDRDMLQLVNSHVKVCVPVKGLSETKTYGESEVIEEFGVKPAQWVDVKALKGDASDNYPGVPGIGPKTAENLIAEFGTLENLYKNLGKVPENVGRKLAEGAESAGLSQKLARIVTDVPGIDLELEKSRVDEIDWKKGVGYMRDVLKWKTIPEKIERGQLNKISDSVTQLPNKKDESQMRLV